LGANWLNVGNIYGNRSGYVEYVSGYAYQETIDNYNNTITSQTTTSNLYTHFDIDFKQQTRGYISKPWIGLFTVNTTLDSKIDDFHSPSKVRFESRGRVNGKLEFLPYSRYNSVLSLDYSPEFTYDNTDELQTSQHASLDFTQFYDAIGHEGEYSGKAHYSQLESSLTLTGQQFLGRNRLTQNAHQTQTTAIPVQNRQKISSVNFAHKYLPEYSGVFVNNYLSATEIDAESGQYSGPQLTVINTNLTYMYDSEYVDTNTVPSIGGSASLVLDRAGILNPQMAANVGVGWPVWHQLKMSTQLNYSDSGYGSVVTLAHQARRGFKSKVVGQIKYDRYLQGSLQNRWAADDSQLTWNLGGGHSVRYPQVYELLQPISVGITQDFNFTGTTAEILQGGSLSHSAVLSTTRRDVTISSSLTDARSYQFATNSSVAVQNAQLSLAKPIIKDTYVESNAKFNLQWQQIQRASGNSTNQWASLQYRYDNRRIANQRNLSGNYTVTGKVDGEGNSLSASGAINYRIGSVQVGGKSSITLLNAKRFSAELNVKRFF